MSLDRIAIRRHMMRRKTCTVEFMEHVSELAAQGWSIPQISAYLECNPRSLRVKCCIHKVSLREIRGEAAPRKAHNPDIKYIVASLSRTSAKKLKKQAKELKIKDYRLASFLIEKIASDDLFNAISDGEKIETEAA